MLSGSCLVGMMLSLMVEVVVWSGMDMFAIGSWSLLQVVYRVFEDADLQPLLDAVNEETQKEKESES